MMPSIVSADAYQNVAGNGSTRYHSPATAANHYEEQQMGTQSSNPRGASSTARRYASKRRSISWSSAPTDSLHQFIATLTDSGHAVMFGRTMDEGALSLVVLAGNDKFKEYITEPG